MMWFLQHGRLDMAIVRKLYNERSLRPTEFIESVFERIACCAVPHIQALARAAETLQGLPRVAGSAV